MLLYNTRDGDKNDITKEVEVKKYDAVKQDFTCFCGKQCTQGIPIKKIVSTNFTDWSYVSDYVCEDCADLFSLFKFSFIKDKDGIRLLNVREMAQEIIKPQKPPFMIIVSKSQKKHLFYKSKINHDKDNFITNLEEEQIQCNLQLLQEQFKFVSCMQALGESKTRLADGEIKLDILQKTDFKLLSYLQEQLKTRQFQIPLFLSQQAELEEVEACKILKSLLNS